MPWFIESPLIPEKPSLPNYGAASTVAVNDQSQEVIAAGTSPRFISISVPVDADPVYVSYGSAVDVATGNYNFIIPSKFQHSQLEIPAQAVHMATSAAGKIANIIVALSE